MSLETPRFFYFDLGNVILNFDHEVACQQMASVAGIDAARVREVVFESDLQPRYEAGQITTGEFYDEFCNRTGSNPDQAALLHAASSIFTLNVSMAPLVTHLRAAGHRIGILSNTCEAHWDYVSSGRYRLLTDYFDIRALSHEIQAAKPSAEIYESAAKLAGESPESIFFVDDRPENVEAARQYGFDAVQYETTLKLAHQLRDRHVRTGY